MMLHYVIVTSLGFASIATVIRPMASVLPSLDSAPAESRLHNVRNAMNTFDKFRYTTLYHNTISSCRTCTLNRYAIF